MIAEYQVLCSSVARALEGSTVSIMISDGMLSSIREVYQEANRAISTLITQSYRDLNQSIIDSIRIPKQLIAPTLQSWSVQLSSQALSQSRDQDVMSKEVLARIEGKLDLLLDQGRVE